MKRLRYKNLTIFKKLLLSASLLFIITVFIIMFMLYSNRHYYKDALLQKLSEYTLFSFSAHSIEIEVFPTISLIMNDVDIEFKELETIYKIFRIKRLKLTISLKSLFSDEIHLRNIYFHKGDLYLYSIFFQAGNKPKQRFDLSKLSQILSISFADIGVHYYDKSNRLKHSFLVNKLNLDSDITGNNNIILDCSIDSGFMRLRGEVGNIDFRMPDFKQIEFNAILSLTNFPICILKKYFQFLPFSKAACPFVTGDVRIIKENNEIISFQAVNCAFQNLLKKDSKIFPQIIMDSEIDFFFTKDIITFKSINVKCGDIINAASEGILIIKKEQIELKLNIISEELIIQPLIELLSVITETFSPKDRSTDGIINISSIIDIEAGKFVLSDYVFNDLKGRISIDNNKYNIAIDNSNIYNGSFACTGLIENSDILSYNFNVFIDDIDIHQLLLNYSENKYITGRMSSSFNLSSKGNIIEIFNRFLTSKGKVEIHNGELFGYANILKPLFSLGKFLNVLGPKGESTEFKSLNFKFNIAKKNITIDSLKMEGVALDASGNGDISFERVIDFRILIGLGGYIGKVIRVPIIYKGELFKHWAYIDPVWLGSVYVGMTIIPGPPGAVAGSTLSGYLQKLYNKAKSKLSFSNK